MGWGIYGIAYACRWISIEYLVDILLNIHLISSQYPQDSEGMYMGIEYLCSMTPMHFSGVGMDNPIHSLRIGMRPRHLSRIEIGIPTHSLRVWMRIPTQDDDSHSSLQRGDEAQNHEGVYWMSLDIHWMSI